MEGANVTEYHYCDKPIHVKKYCGNKTREEKPRNYKNEVNKNKFII